MNKLQAILIAGLLSLSSVSFATAITTFDFLAEAAGNERGAENIVLTAGDLTVTTSGTYNGGTADAYLDNGGGLGVCHTGLSGTAQCITPSDDNVTSNETLILDFGHLVRIDELNLLDANHGTKLFEDNVADFSIKVDGVLFDLAGVTAFELSASPTSVIGLIGKTFEFINNGGGQNYEFYISNISVTAVPVPAAGILFASALFGAGVFGRRKKKAQASVVGAFARAS